MKKIISLILAILMIATFVPLTFAEAKKPEKVERELAFNISECSCGREVVSYSDADTGITFEITATERIVVHSGCIEMIRGEAGMRVTSSNGKIVSVTLSGDGGAETFAINSNSATQSLEVKYNTLMINDRPTEVTSVSIKYETDYTPYLTIKKANGNVEYVNIKDVKDVTFESGVRSTYIPAPGIGDNKNRDANAMYRYDDILVTNSNGSAGIWCFCYDNATVKFATNGHAYLRNVDYVYSDHSGVNYSVSTGSKGDVSSTKDYFKEFDVTYGDTSTESEIVLTTPGYSFGQRVTIDYFDYTRWLVIELKDGTKLEYCPYSTESIKVDTVLIFDNLDLDIVNNATGNTDTFALTDGFEITFSNNGSTINLSDKNGNTEVLASYPTVDATGVTHELGEYKTVSNPSCTTAGLKKKTCSICNYEEEATIAALGHQDTVTEENRVNPTCSTVGGYDNYNVCERCHRQEFVEHITLEKTAHIEGEWEIVKEATEDETGLKVKKCTECSETIATETIEKLPKTEPETKEETTTEETTVVHHDDTEYSDTCLICGRDHHGNIIQDFICLVKSIINKIVAFFNGTTFGPGAHFPL